MRSQIFWLAVIALALAAIGGGYMSGSASAPQLRRTAGKPHPAASVHAVLKDPSDAQVDDAFSEDDVVVERSRVRTARWYEPRLAVVVGLCGASPAADSAFVNLGAPITVDIDPAAREAADVAEIAHDANDLVLIHLDAPPGEAELERLRRRFPHFDGIASRRSSGFVQALDGTGLLFFDERGDAVASDFERAGIPFAQRDTTVDDRTARSYIHFMLARAVQRSQREGLSVVLMRPMANSRDVLAALIATRTVQIAPLTAGS